MLCSHPVDYVTGLTPYERNMHFIANKFNFDIYCLKTISLVFLY